MAEDPFLTSQQQTQHIYRPIPRRNFNNTSFSEPNIHTHHQSQSSQSQSQLQSQTQTQAPSQSQPQSHSHSQSLSQSQSDESIDLWTQNTPPALVNARHRSSDFLAQLNARLLRSAYTSQNGYSAHQENGDTGGAPSRNKSYLNMTSSTLYGIYDDVGSNLGTAGERSVVDTPWGTGAETPARHYSIDSNYSNGWDGGMGSPDGGLTMRTKERARRRRTSTETARSRQQQAKQQQKSVAWRASLAVGKLSALFIFGVTYGVIVSHLHDSRELAAVNVGGFDRESWIYFTGWGVFGISLGSLLPYLDLVWDGDAGSRAAVEDHDDDDDDTELEKSSESSLGEQWNEVVRSIGAFVGIAFAIRRLPWQSTLQLTLTLALVNPALWYILDRSKLGFSFSLITTSILTSFIFLSNPDVLPSPALPATTSANATSLPAARAGFENDGDAELFAGIVSYGDLATVTWVGSVIFCSCVCFGGIGRRLAVFEGWGSGNGNGHANGRGR